VTVHQFELICRTEIIAIVQCMYADYVVWGDGSGGWLMTFNREGDSLKHAPGKLTALL